MQRTIHGLIIFAEMIALLFCHIALIECAVGASTSTDHMVSDYTSRSKRARQGDIIDVKDFGALGNGTTDDYIAIAAALRYVQEFGRTLCFPPGIYKTNSELNITTNGIALVACDNATGYSYEPPSHMQSATILAGRVMTNVINYIPTETSQITNYGAVKGLIIDGNRLAKRCLNIAGASLVQEVTVTGCTDAGIRLGDLTNQTHLEYISAVANTGGTGYGLLVQGISTTTYSVRGSNFRSNTTGVRLEAGVNVNFENTVIESNSGVGLSLYKPAGANMYNFLFRNVWWENNSVGTSGYNIALTSQILSLQEGAAFIQFENCNINSSGSARHIHIESARYVRFDRCSGLSGDRLNGVQLSTNASYVEFTDWNGAAITDNGNRNFTSGRATSGTKGWKLSGGITERGYAAAMGEWTNVAHDAANFSASTGRWIVNAADQLRLRYMIIGKTMWVDFSLANTSVSAMARALRITLPAKKKVATRTQGLCIYRDNAGAESIGVIDAAGTTLTFLRKYYENINWSDSAGRTDVIGTISFEIE